MPPVDDEIVSPGLARDGLSDRGVEQVVALRRAQRAAQIGGILLAEAHVKRAGASHPHPIAGLAEIVGERSYEAEPTAGLRGVDVAGRTASPVVDILERVAL